MKWKIKIFFYAVALALFLAFAFWLAGAVLKNEAIREFVAGYGYFGLFIISLVNGFNLFVPVPTPALMPSLLEAGLNFYISFAIITVSTTIADLIAYFLARSGRELFPKAAEGKIVKKLDQWQKKRWWLPIAAMFLFSALAPLPNELLTAPLGFLRYRWQYVFMAVLGGKIFYTLIYSLGFIGLFGIL